MVNKKSLWISIFNAGDCKGCVLECFSLTSPKYDIERFGCLLKTNPKQADVLLVVGAGTKKSRNNLKDTYSQMTQDKKVIAIGACAISGGIFRNAYNCIEGIDKIIPVDYYVPGCPPRPEAILNALLKLLGGSDKRKKNWFERF